MPLRVAIAPMAAFAIEIDVDMFDVSLREGPNWARPSKHDSGGVSRSILADGNAGLPGLQSATSSPRVL